MLSVNASDEHVAARLLDFFHSATPWHRALWEPGLVLTLAEVLEASVVARAGVLHEATVKHLAGTAITLCGRDPGTGSEEQMKRLQAALRSELRPDGLEYRVVRQILEDVRANYLVRWSDALRAGQPQLRPERTARAIAAHLLESGLSSDFLHRWWTYKLRHEPVSRSLWEFVGEAHTLACAPKKAYQVLVAFDGAPEGQSRRHPQWLSSKEVVGWLGQHGFTAEGVKQNGGIVFPTSAMDADAAVESIVELVDRLASRVALGTNGRLTPLPRAWVVGEPKPFPFRRRRRGVRVPALHREDQLYSDTKSGIVDAALELLAPLDAGSPSPAVAGAWAAIEALLSGPEGGDNKVTAGDRMATIIACSFPRAELTMLSYAKEVVEGPTGVQLAACRSNRDRAATLGEAINTGLSPVFKNASDTAALARMKGLLASPHKVLKDVELHVATAFRRLYRQRNLVLHGGRTDAVALRASLRTAAPLVSAGMDRVAHAWFVEEVAPLELAARASIRLELVGTTVGLGAVDLLA